MPCTIWARGGMVLSSPSTARHCRTAWSRASSSATCAAPSPTPGRPMPAWSPRRSRDPLPRRGRMPLGAGAGGAAAVPAGRNLSSGGGQGGAAEQCAGRGCEQSRRRRAHRRRRLSAGSLLPPFGPLVPHAALARAPGGRPDPRRAFSSSATPRSTASTAPRSIPRRGPPRTPSLAGKRARARECRPPRRRPFGRTDRPGRARDAAPGTARAERRRRRAGPARAALDLFPQAVADDQAIPVPFGLSYREAKSAVVNAFERAYIEHALRAAEGNLSRAARECGKERSRLGRLLRKHKVRRADFQA